MPSLGLLLKWKFIQYSIMALENARSEEVNEETQKTLGSPKT